jgi:hypothetical protein
MTIISKPDVVVVVVLELGVMWHMPSKLPSLFSQISIPGFPDCFPQGRFCESPKHSKLIKSQFNPVQSFMAIISNLRVVVLLGAMWHRPI